MLIALPGKPSAAHFRYRVEISSVESIAAESGTTSDTFHVSAVLALTITDGDSTRLASVAIESVSSRSRGVATTSVPALEGYTYNVTLRPGLPPVNAHGTGDQNQIVSSRAGSMLAAAIPELFVVIPPGVGIGNELTDTARTNTGFKSSTWSVIRQDADILTLRAVDSVSFAGTSPDGETLHSTSTATRTIRSTRAGPVLALEIVRQSDSKGSDPMDGPMTISQVRKITYMQLP